MLDAEKVETDPRRHVTTSNQNEQFDEISDDILACLPGCTVSLTQQELDRGLDTLHQAVLRQGLPLPLVILIEDDNNEANFFRQALKDIGVAVEFMHFRDGNQALDFFSGRGCYSDRERYPLPQLTVLDINLTRASGLEILQQIRTKSHLSELVVVALTGSEDVRQIELARSLDINGWFNKPNRAKDLIQIVRSLLFTWLPSSN
jgi:CheY-like chemotaxis protein